jgi:hypothetical protein
METYFTNASFLAAYGQDFAMKNPEQLLTVRSHSGPSLEEDYIQGQG